MYKSGHHLELHKDGNDITLPTYSLFKNNEIVNSGTYNILGIYFKNERQWTWGWAIHNKTKVETYLCRMILNYALDMTFVSSKTTAEILRVIIRSDMLSSIISIEHPVQLEQYLAIGQYITKSDMVYKIDNHPDYGSNVTVYALLKYTDL